jgi:hypothetical protein
LIPLYFAILFEQALWVKREKRCIGKRKERHRKERRKNRKERRENRKFCSILYPIS